MIISHRVDGTAAMEVEVDTSALTWHCATKLRAWKGEYKAFPWSDERGHVEQAAKYAFAWLNGHVLNGRDQFIKDWIAALPCASILRLGELADEAP